jgi:hypothetical protein
MMSVDAVGDGVLYRAYWRLTEGVTDPEWKKEMHDVK